MLGRYDVNEPCLRKQFARYVDKERCGVEVTIHFARFITSRYLTDERHAF